MGDPIIRVPIPEACLRRALGDEEVDLAYIVAREEEETGEAAEVFVGAYLTPKVMARLGRRAA